MQTLEQTSTATSPLENAPTEPRASASVPVEHKVVSGTPAPTEPRASASVPVEHSIKPPCPPPGPKIANRNSEFGNHVAPSIPFENSILRPGDIGFANESRFLAAFFSEPLTEYAQGWHDPNNLQELLNFVAPPVQVGRRFEYKRADNAEAFLLDTDDARAIGSDFKRVEYRGSSVNDKTYNRGLTIRVDLDAVGDMPDWRELYTTRLLQRILRSELRRAMDVIVNGATNVAKTWDTSAGKDPDQDVINELITASDSSGLRPNRVLYGDVAWSKRQSAHRAQASAGGFASAVMTLDQVASALGVDAIRISRERYQSGAATKSKITPDVVVLFYSQDRVTGEDPTHVKRFWSPVEGGGNFRVYEQQVSAKMVDLTVEHYSNVVATSTVGLRKLTIS